jgi:alpha-L-arabinofuranosidase
LSVLFLFTVHINIYADEPDSAYIFAYGENGLRFAWSIDKENWHPIGNGHPFVKSDFGRWGSQKRMYDPVLYRAGNGLWHCLWTLNDDVGVIAHTTSGNLTYWKPQSYPYLFEGQGNCRMIEIGYDPDKDGYFISWVNTKGQDKELFGTFTKDFKHFEPARKIPEAARINQRDVMILNGESQTGTTHQIAWTEIDHLIKTWQIAEYRNGLHNELMRDDPVRFAGLKPVEVTVTVDPSKSKPISNMLIGIFFEDINYAADGGLYAELIRNRDFEFSGADHREWNARSAWTLNGEHIGFHIETSGPVHENNKHYAVLDIRKPGTGLINEGFDGIPLKKGDKYDFSVFIRGLEGRGQSLLVRLTGKNGEVYGVSTIKNISQSWKKHFAVITANETVNDARLEIIPQAEGKIALDMVSLFPQKTFRGRKNGLRADLAQTLADMHPRFVRFPGGCVAHGDGMDNIYRWKNTIGPLESRKPDRNLWGYHQTMGLGYYEYFLFCEDIGAEPLPVLAAGVPCQNSGTGGHGQQCGIPLDEMQDYIQEIFDLIEWANGDPKKNKWAKMRADAGHPEPFGLKYIGIGNEDLISDVFEERFVMICRAIKEKYPEMMIVGTAGPFYEGSDYTEGWRVATETGIQMIDEHYYVPPGWFIHNQDYYDRYDRSKPRVYLGEYAAHVPGRHNNIETALTEALHLANIERNGDIVALTSYAPLLAKEKHTQWSPDLIYFNNTEVKPTVGYHVQKLYGQNPGDEYLTSLVKVSDGNSGVCKRIACSVVRDSKTGDIIIKLLNLLPVEAKAMLNIDDLNVENTAVKTVLTGKPDDRRAEPVSAQVTFSGEMELSAYSFTVLRMKVKND